MAARETAATIRPMWWAALALAHDGDHGRREPALMAWGAGSALALGGGVALVADKSGRSDVGGGLAIVAGGTVALCGTAADAMWFRQHDRLGPQAVWASGLLMAGASIGTGLTWSLWTVAQDFTCLVGSPCDRPLGLDLLGGVTVGLAAGGLGIALVGEPVVAAFTDVHVMPKLEPGGGSLIVAIRF